MVLLDALIVCCCLGGFPVRASVKGKNRQSCRVTFTANLKLERRKIVDLHIEYRCMYAIQIATALSNLRFLKC